MRFLLISALILAAALPASAYTIRASHQDVSCDFVTNEFHRFIARVLVKGKPVKSFDVGDVRSLGEESANAFVAYCDGIIALARNIRNSTVLIQTHAVLDSGQVLRIEGDLCR